jgi:hypothetical protein
VPNIKVCSIESSPQDVPRRGIFLKQFGVLVLAASFLNIGCASEQPNVSKVPADWHRLNAGYFSVYAPPGWTFHKLQGVDSYVGEFVGDGTRLKFDYGLWSSPLDEAHGPKYAVDEESIGGYRAKIVSPRVPGQGVTGIYFPKITEKNKHCLYGQNLSASHQELALRIFRTIRFGEPKL